jgi:hypothetical protein
MATFHPDCHNLKCNEKPPNWFNRLLHRIGREIVQETDQELDRDRPYRVEHNEAEEMTR